jgi:hypothetical protein
MDNHAKYGATAIERMPVAERLLKGYRSCTVIDCPGSGRFTLTSREVGSLIDK